MILNNTQNYFLFTESYNYLMLIFLKVRGNIIAYDEIFYRVLKLLHLRKK